MKLCWTVFWWFAITLKPKLLNNHYVQYPFNVSLFYNKFFLASMDVLSLFFKSSYKYLWIYSDRIFSLESRGQLFGLCCRCYFTFVCSVRRVTFYWRGSWTFNSMVSLEKRRFFPVSLRTRLISNGLEPILCQTKKWCITSYYIQF